MNYENFKKGFDKPTIITAQQYGTKVSVELDHSDTDIDELFDAFETLVIGLGYHQSTWKQWILDRADEYNEDDTEDLKQKLSEWKFDYENADSWFEDNERMDIIGQNGNEGLHYDSEERYRATQEDEDEFSDDGGFDGKPHFEWGDEPEDTENLFEGDEWEANDELKAANERYKKEVKKMSAKPKLDKTKVVKGKIKDLKK